MAAHGFLNHVKHTGNTKEQLKLWGKENYTNENGYIEKQCVYDKNIVTARDIWSFVEIYCSCYKPIPMKTL